MEANPSPNGSDPVKRGPSLRKNLGYSSFARAYQALTQFAVIALVARLGTAEELGLLTLSAAIVVPLFFLTSLGMKDIHTVDDLDRFSNADYVALRLLGGSVAILLSASIAVVGYGHESTAMQSTIVAFAVLRFFWSQAGLVHAMFQRVERLDLVALSIVVRCSLGLAVFALVFLQTGSLVLALTFEALSAFAVYHFLDRALLAGIGASVSRADLASVRPRRLLQLLYWTLPLGLALWLGRAVGSAPPIVLEREAGLAAAGLFGALAYFHTGLSMLATGFHNATAARLRRHYRSGERRAFWRLTGKLLLVSAGLAAVALAGAWLLGVPILTLLYGPAYADRVLLIVIVGASSLGLLSAPLMTVIASAHAFRLRLAVAAVALAASVLASFLLVPALGVLGAAWALMVGFAVQLAAALTACLLLFRQRAASEADDA
jgi:O-antigen/teichoic acid export membrane protein